MFMANCSHFLLIATDFRQIIYEKKGHLKRAYKQMFGPHLFKSKTAVIDHILRVIMIHFLGAFPVIFDVCSVSNAIFSTYIFDYFMDRNRAKSSRFSAYLLAN